MSPQVRVDPIVCRGHGLCADWLPERIVLDEWGYPIVDPAQLTPEELAMARRAVKECPVRALRLAATPE